MKYHNTKILCLVYDEFVPAIMKADTFQKNKQRGNIIVHGRGGNGNEILIEYETIKDKKVKEKIVEVYGNPYEYISIEPLKAMMKYDEQAEKFYLAKGIDTEIVTKLAQAAGMLNLIVELYKDKKTLKNLCGNLDIANKRFIKIIEVENIDLPTSNKRLLYGKDSLLSRYKESSYEVLIHGNTGKRNAAKVTDELSLKVLEDLLANHNGHDDVVVMCAYNKWAATTGYKLIMDEKTVCNYRNELKVYITQEREGNVAWYNEFGKSIAGKRSAFPMACWESDDNDLDKYFIETIVRKVKDPFTGITKDKITYNHYYRPTLVVVTDAAFNDYPLGWACGDEQTIDLVKAAYLDAMHHVHDLTGGWYLPHQLKTDRWGLDTKNTTQLGQFYKSIDPQFFAAAAKGPRGKYIEQSFGKRWHKYLKQDEYNNYAGPNVKSRGEANPDMLELYKKDRPKKEDLVYHVEEFINKVRQHRTNNGNTLQQQWLDGFWASEVSQQRAITHEQMFLKFGLPHIVPSAANPELPNTCTKDGIILHIDNVKYRYDIPEEYYLESIGKQVQVIYDPQDMTHALITDNNKLRFIAPCMEEIARTRIEMDEHMEAKFWQKMQQKKRHMEVVAARVTERKALLKTHGVNTAKMLSNVSGAESLLQAGVLDKTLKQSAEKAYHRKEVVMVEATKNDRLAYLNSQTNFDEY